MRAPSPSPPPPSGYWHVQISGDDSTRHVVGPCASAAEAIAQWKREMGILATPYHVHAGLATEAERDQIIAQRRSAHAPTRHPYDG
jgi:hypothetical protein